MFAKCIAAIVLLGSVSLAQGPVLSLAIDNATALGGGALEITSGSDWRMHITALKPLVHVDTWAIFHTLDHQSIPWIFARLRDDAVQGNTVFTQTFTLPPCSVDVGLQLACVGTFADGTQILLTRELTILAGTGDF